MNHRYRIKVVLTSLALAAAVTGSTTRPSPPPLTCAAIHRLYSRVALRRARAALLLALAQAHERRAAVAARRVRGEREGYEIVGKMSLLSRASQETRDPRLKHLLAILATTC